MVIEAVRSCFQCLLALLYDGLEVWRRLLIFILGYCVFL